LKNSDGDALILKSVLRQRQNRRAGFSARLKPFD